MPEGSSRSIRGTVLVTDAVPRRSRSARLPAAERRSVGRTQGEQLDWEAVGAIGEVVGAAAVVATLLFLVSQLRQNTTSLDATRTANVSQLYQFRAQMHMEGMLRKAEAFGLSLADVMSRLQTDGIESLNQSEKIFLICHATADAVRLDNGLFQHRNGFLDDDYAAYVERSIRMLAPHWEQIDLFGFSGFRQGFIDEVNRILASDESPT